MVQPVLRDAARPRERVLRGPCVPCRLRNRTCVGSGGGVGAGLYVVLLPADLLRLLHHVAAGHDAGVGRVHREVLAGGGVEEMDLAGATQIVASSPSLIRLAPSGEITNCVRSDSPSRSFSSCANWSRTSSGM